MNPIKPATETIEAGTTAAAIRPRSAPGGESFWHELLGAFSPNRVISKSAFRFIVVFQIAVLLMVWATSA